MFIKWEKPDLKLQVEHIDLTLSLLVAKRQTCTQSPLIYSRKGIWKGNLTRAKVLGKEGGKVTTLRVFPPSFP